MSHLEFQPDPIDAQQLELLAKIPVAKRALAMMQTSEWVLAGIRDNMRKRFPEWSQRELNLRVMAYVTPMRGITVEELLKL